jgi:hypothetical protein
MSTGTDRTDGKYLQKTRSAHKLLSCASQTQISMRQEEKVEVVTQCNGISDITAMKRGNECHGGPRTD